jgi:hypothetical protein
MALPQSKTQLQTWIRQQLGEPVITVNLAPVQIDNCIDSAFEYFEMYHEVASEKTFLMVQLTQDMIDNKAIELPENVLGVTMVHGIRTGGGGSGIFDFQYQFWQANVQSIVAYSGAVGYFVTQQFLSEMNWMLNPKVNFRYNSATNQLNIDAKMSSLWSVGQYIMVECYAILDKNEYTKLWGNRWVRELALAYARKQWGDNLRKFTAVLPNGVTLNGDAIFEEGIQAIEKWEAEIRQQTVPYGFYVG